MPVVKTVEFRKNLKEILEKIYNGEEGNFFLDYYGKLFQITPVGGGDKKSTKTKTQKFIEKYSNLPKMNLTDPIFNELDPAQEKENIRNLMAKRYEK